LSKIKYKYNPESLSYEKVELTTWQRIVKSLPYVGLAIVFSVVVSIIAFTFFKSPGQKADTRRINFLEAQLKETKNRMVSVEKLLTLLQDRDDRLRASLEGAKYPDQKRHLSTGGSKPYAALEGYDNSELIISVAKKLDEIEKRIYAQSKSYDELVDMAKRKDKMLVSIPAIIPLANHEVTAHTGHFGWRIDPIYRTRQFHSGMDFPCKSGTKIRATGDAVVENVESGFWGYGNIVLLNHGFGYQTMYAHLSGFNVKKGQKVKRGDVIGFAGSTGKSTAPHLHYEVIKNGEKINPVNFYFNDLTPSQYSDMIKASQETSTSFD
jgi:murein DD-endopeptidase MepM/ murein hydrolase activator NlpD